MNRIYKILFFLCLLPLISQAQSELDYEDDINPYVLGDSINLAVPLFIDFFKSNNEHPAANIQLALIYEGRYQNANPIADYESAIKNAERAKFFFSRARNLITEKEVRKNAWYYPNFTSEFKRNGKPDVEFDSVKMVFEKGYVEADSFGILVPAIHRNFLKMVEQYDLASKTFVRINGDYNSLKDIYLLHNAELDKRFDILVSSYDSTLYYYDQYIEAARKYEKFDPQQKLTFKDINTYRLDGLVIQTDFFVNTVSLWDYKTWVEEQRKVLHTDIAQLRTEIVEIEQKLNKTYRLLENWNFKDTLNIKKIDRREIYKIRKYDLNSTVANLFEYKEDKIDLAYEQKNLQLNDTSAEFSLELKLYSLNKIFQRAVRLKEELKKYNDELLLSNLNKNEDFYNKYYNGIEGLKNYFVQEENWVNNSLKNVSSTLKTEIANEFNKPFTREPLKFKKLNLVWQQPETGNDSLSSNSVAIHFSEMNFEELEYLAGSFKDSEGVAKAFYVGVSGSEVVWYNNVSSKLSQTYQQIGDINLTAGGELCIMLHERNLDSLNFTNRILKIDEKGIVKNEINFETQDKPLKITSLRSSNKLLAIFQGDGLGDAIWPKKATIALYHPDSSTYESKEININGQFVGVFQTSAGITIAAISEDNKQIYFTQLNTDLSIKKEKSYKFNEALNLKLAYQVSEENLNLISLPKENGHLIITDNLDVRFSDTGLTAEEI